MLQLHTRRARPVVAASIHLFGCLLLAALGSVLLGSCARREQVTGIVLISIDTLRADHLGCYGYKRNTSPFLDQLAARGARFEQAVSTSSWTLPSHASMLTGLYPASHRAVDASSSIAPSAATAAELLQGEGFATGAIVTSWFVSANYGFDRGFDLFHDLNQTGHETAGKVVRAKQVVDLAAEWLEDRADQRFFLFLHLYDTHYAYNPLPPYRKLFATDYTGPRRRYRNYGHYKKNPLPAERLAFEVSLYDGEIRYVDDQLARFYGVLEKLELHDNTLIIVTSDHGEEFGERGSWGHGHTLYEEQVHVPLIVVGPGVEGPLLIEQQVGHVDLLPTILEVAGLSAPEKLQGRSLIPLLRGRGATNGPPSGDGRPVFMESSRFGTNLIALKRKNWKLILDLTTGRESLFDLSEDPGEQQDLAADRDDMAARFRAETISVVETLVPDRWNLTWLDDGAAELAGELLTGGAMVEVSLDDGSGKADISTDLHKITFRLQPNETLSWKTVPVDAEVTISAPPTAGGSEVPLIIGEAREPVEAFPFEISVQDAAVAGGSQSAELRAAVLWIDSNQELSDPVRLRRANRRRLKALGYIVD